MSYGPDVEDVWECGKCGVRKDFPTQFFDNKLPEYKPWKESFNKLSTPLKPKPEIEWWTKLPKAPSIEDFNCGYWDEESAKEYYNAKKTYWENIRQIIFSTEGKSLDKK